MSVSNFTSATFSVVKKYTQLACIFVSKISHHKSALKFACKKCACKSSCKNLHPSFLRGFFVKIRHIARNLRACKCCNARGLYCSLCNTTLQPLTTKIQCYTVLIYSTFVFYVYEVSKWPIEYYRFKVAFYLASQNQMVINGYKKNM